MPPIYTGLSEDDRFISKLLTAQNVMVNIQTELTRLIQDYIDIKKKDQKRREKKKGRNGTAAAVPMPPKRKKSTKNVQTPPVAKKPKHSNGTAAIPPMAPAAPAPLVQGMLKTRKNNLTLEEGNKLKSQIANLSGAQQMTVLEILRENKEHLEQDEEGNVEMEFRDFSQKSINDLKAYVSSVTMGGNPKPSHQSSAAPSANMTKDDSGSNPSRGLPKNDSGSDSDTSSSDSASDDSD